MDKALYFYSIRIQDHSSSYRLMDGTVETSKPLANTKEFNEMRELLFDDLGIDKSKAVFTSFSRL